MRQIYREPVHWNTQKLLGVNIWGILNKDSRDNFFSTVLNYSVLYDKIASENFFSLTLTPLYEEDK